MPFLGRLLLVAFALVLAIPCGAVALGLGLVVDPVANAWITRAGLAGLDAALSDLSAGLPPESVGLLAAGLAQAAFVVLVLPPALVAAIGEVLRLRALAWYGGGCGVLTALLPWLARGAVRPGGDAAQLAAEGRATVLLFVVGAVAGLIYWAVAGRRTSSPAAVT